MHNALREYMLESSTKPENEPAKPENVTELPLRFNFSNRNSGTCSATGNLIKTTRLEWILIAISDKISKEKSRYKKNKKF